MVHDIEIQRYTYAQDNSMGSRKIPTTTLSTKARIQPMKPRQVLEFARLGSKLDFMIYTIVDPGITTAKATEYRVKFGSRVFEVVGVTNTDELSVFWTIYCCETKTQQDDL